MSWYAFYQKVGGNEKWHPLLADHRKQVLDEVRPQFITALDVDNAFEEELDSEALAKLHYRGDLYVDFDSTDIEEAIEQFKEFCTRLQALNVDLDMLSLYATGGKGFHCIIPCACYMPKIQTRGVLLLPYIYKEMMAGEELYVDTLDLRVYTARQGRQFRVANIERLSKSGEKTGRFKVPISAAEALAMNKERYDLLVTSPRPEITPKPPELNTNLALLWQTAFDKLEAAAKKPKKSKVDTRLLKRFKGEIPPSIANLMAGENVADGVGFQQIAMQVALTMHALAIPEDQMLTLCAGLIKQHKSNGNRYHTPEKRRRELSRMWRHMENNPSYDFSVGGIKSVIDKDFDTPDLDSGGVDIEEEEEADARLDAALLHGMRVNTAGIFRKVEGELMQICGMGLSNPKQLLDIGTEEVLGYEVDIYVDGKKKATKVIDMAAFTSRSRFLAFTLSSAGVNMSATDHQVGAIADILRARAEQNGDKVYTVQSEGLDVIVRPDGELDVVWADRNGVRSASGTPYKLVGGLTTELDYGSDIGQAPPLDATPEAREYFDRLFAINAPEVVAKMMGWYTICFFSQFVRHLYNQFPSLQCAGQAGSGKSKTSELFMRMHYWRMPPKLSSAGSLTPFVVDALASGSASIPMFVDEFKPRQMRRDRVDKIENLLRENYTRLGSGRGRLSNETGTNKIMIKQSRNAAPITIMTEGAVLQTAIMDRMIYVPFSIASRSGHQPAFNYCVLHAETLSGFGRLCLEKAMQVNVKALGKMIMANQQAVIDAVGEVADKLPRPVFNAAVLLTGLEIAEILLRGLFGDHFSAHFERFRTCLIATPDALVPKQQSELAKVLDTFAYLSSLSDPEDRTRVIEGEDYYVASADVVEVKIRSCWDKYVRYRRSLGDEVLFDGVDAFMHGCVNSGGVIDRFSPGSGLKKTPATTVYTFDRTWLRREGVSDFHE